MISAVVLTKNETENIGGCIRSLSFCDEVLVIDDNSNDETRKIATRLGAKVVKRGLDSDFASQNNFALRSAQYNWVLFVDADERVSEALSKEILQKVDSGEYKVYSAKRKDYLWGKWLTHGEVGAFEAIRLVRKNTGRWERRVHQFFKTSDPVAKLRNPIKHYPHKSLRKFIVSIDRWSSWHAIANSEEGKKSTVSKIMFYPIGHFVRNYIVRCGFLDGMPGLVFALTMAGHSYLAWSKLWLLQRKSTKAQVNF